MSLRVWLPLNGNYKNQGLNGDIIPEVMGTGITFTSGKIGKAATFPNNCNSCIHMPGFNLQEGTICAWVKINGESSGANQRIISEGRDSYSDGTELILNKAGTQMTFKAHKVSVSTNVELNKWMHVVGVFGNNNISLFINGIKKSSTTYTEATPYDYSNNRFVLGKMSYSYTSTGNYFPFNGQLNDVRVYDHCLSIKEIEEISKGLILHYKLDNNGLGGKNLISNFDTSFMEYSDGISTLFVNQMNGGTQEIISNFNGAIKCLHLHNLGGNGRQYRTWSVQAGKTYTISADYYSENAQSTAWRGELNGGNYSWLGANAAYTTPGKWQRLSYTYNNLTSDATIYFFIYCAVNQDCYIKNIKIEEGSIATFWSPYVNENIIYDSSGYQHNGDLIGTITNFALTPRYNVSTHFIDGSYGRIQERPSICLPTDSITVNLWARIDTWGNPISCTEGGGWNFENSSGIQFPVYVASIGYKVANSGVTPATLGNTWHMLTGTFDREHVKIYVDSVLKKTTATGSTNPIGYANNYLFLAAEASGNNTSPANSAFVGDLSDLRIYCTALTEDQIKELYDTSVTIDKDGNIYAREVQEI